MGAHLSNVRVRFAPSPTGYLHIGGVRTALFNWLFARKHGGAFILRVDDTDRQRNVDEALAPILAGFRWLGLDWDEGPEVGGESGPYFQSERSEIYQSAVERLLDAGVAYRDFATTEELAAERAEAEAKKERFIYSRRWRATTDEECQAYESEGRESVVRLEMPREGQCVIEDLIRGTVEFDWAREQDHVIQRADGSVIYHLASVVDDDAMGITHVIRAEEHLSNTPRQVWIARGLGVEPPAFAHLPYVAEPGGKSKLSKRKLAKYMKQPDFAALAAQGEAVASKLGLDPATEASAERFNPVVVDFYRELGFLPQALVNYLLLLGWALDDKTEYFDREAMVESFSLDRVGRAAASFDPQKLEAFQATYMAQESLDSRVALCTPYLVRAGLVAQAVPESEAVRVRAVVAAADDRIKIASDILEYEEFFVGDGEFVFDDKAFDKRVRGAEGAAELLAAYGDELASLPDFELATLEASMRSFVEARSLKLGAIVHAARVAVTGKAVGFGMFETLAILGRDRCIARIRRTIERAGGEGESREDD